MNKILILLMALFLGSHSVSFSQNSNGDWFHIPGLTPEIVGKKEAFYGVMGMAVVSYALSEFILKDSENVNFYKVRLGASNEHFWGFRKVSYQSIGLDKSVSNWFAISGEFHLQQWLDQSPQMETKRSLGMGAGLMTYYRWYLLGKLRLSPYFEYGIGSFMGFKAFPVKGSHFTFSHTSQFGLEYTFKNKDRLRLSYGLFHQSNNNLLDYNPGYDANGFNISYSWYWKNSKW